MSSAEEGGGVEIPEDMKYVKSHEWIKVDGDLGKIGLEVFFYFFGRERADRHRIHRATRCGCELHQGPGDVCGRICENGL